MRVIIAGGRDYELTADDYRFLDSMHAYLHFTEVVCGMARGADWGGKTWAESHGVPVAKFPADWDEYGKRAGYVRNVKMSENADAFICFPGGSGTEHMRRTAKSKGLKWLPTIHDANSQLRT